MAKKRKIFTLEKVKLSSMGPYKIVFIPRVLIKDKVLDYDKIYHIQLEEVLNNEIFE